MIFILYIRKLSPTMLVRFARDPFSSGVGAVAQDVLIWGSLCGVGISTKANDLSDIHEEVLGQRQGVTSSGKP